MFDASPPQRQSLCTEQKGTTPKRRPGLSFSKESSEIISLLDFGAEWSDQERSKTLTKVKRGSKTYKLKEKTMTKLVLESCDTDKDEEQFSQQPGSEIQMCTADENETDCSHDTSLKSAIKTAQNSLLSGQFHS